MPVRSGSESWDSGYFGGVTDRIAEPWGPETPYARGEEWPARRDTFLDPGLGPEDVESWVQSASVLHSNGDAMDIAVRDGRIVGVRGREMDRVNRGRLDPKDLFGWQANNSPDRLTTPLIRRGSKLVECGWDEAMGRIVDRSKQLLDGPGGWGRFGFYTTGQLFLEEYYTLAVIGKAGLATPHMDGNTRLCTATAAASLKESFGSDGQPGSYDDIGHCDTLCLWGHNVAETQAVLWMRMRDRLHGPDRPRLVVVDPRPTPSAGEADIHLPIKNGTNLALVNCICRELIEQGWIDEDWVGEHAIGFEELRAAVSECDPDSTAEICEVPADDIREAARIIGTSQHLFSTVLQGFYQSNQATAAACGVNNIHLLRGMIGRPGAGLCQMNGQPTAQNTRETGADGDLAGFRNWDNPDHVAELAELWSVETSTIPHWAPPTHAMQIWRYAEQGSIKLLWISATNPAVSLPQLQRIRDILAKEELMVVVQDLFLTETAELADVVLPGATWGEKTGTFTNADRTVHLSEKAVDPPGDARSDLDIFLDYADRMGFEDREGKPLIKWSDPESAFEAWKACSKGRPCDYSGLSYEKLRGSGIQWPCTDEAPGGTERLYVGGRFSTDSDYAEDYGHDLKTGATFSEEQHRAQEPRGRAFLKTTAYHPSPEVTSDEYPFLLNTGRTIYHFHTRSKTGRAPQLDEAAPDVWVEVSAEDAADLGISEGDLLELSSPRGRVEGPARISRIRPGIVFVPFHYGDWRAEGREHHRAANELTITAWDPVSKQPIFKVAAVMVRKLAESESPSLAPTTTASVPVEQVPPTIGGEAAESESEIPA
jgi:ferredoxin-nitrate reductase